MIYSEAFDEVGTLLVLAVRGGRTSDQRAQLLRLFATLGEDVVREAARLNQVESLVGDALAREGVELSADWQRALEANRKRVEALEEVTASVLRRLPNAGRRSSLVESAGVLFTSELPRRAFCSGDFDILVEPGDWQAVLDALGFEGFRPVNRRGRPTTRVEHRRDLPSGSTQWLEVGCRPFDRAWVPLDYRDRCAVWLGRTVVSKKSPDVFVLDPSDGVAFVCMHTSLHSFIRAPGLRLHVDVDRLVRDNDIDWDRVVFEVNAMNIPTRAFVSLSMAKGLLDTPVPESALESLAPGRLRRERLLALLQGDGVLWSGQAKLSRYKAVMLDWLLHEGTPQGWARLMFLPGHEWLQEHFDRDGSNDVPLWRLHVRRAKALVTRWRPE